eukprot:5552327-Pyramimonas_sp.AAC.1
MSLVGGFFFGSWSLRTDRDRCHLLASGIIVGASVESLPPYCLLESPVRWTVGCTHRDAR